MKRFLNNYRLPENIEILFLLIIGMIFQMTDGSPFTIKKRWEVVWNTELPPEYFSTFVQHLIKTILSGIVVARCLTTYTYVVSGMLVIFCILKDAAPKTILIWLVISGLKSICMTFVEALIGIYVCSAFGKIRKACVEFFISKALEITFAAYLWGSVLNSYYDMIRRRDEEFQFENWDDYFKVMCFKRQRARSLMDESTLSKTAYLNTFEFKDVPQIMLQMLRREEDMSQDSLLGPGMMLASVSNMGSFDNLRKAQSLGELGILDLKSVRVMDMDEEESLTPAQKALKFLKLSWSDVRNAKERKNENFKQKCFSVDDETWTNVTKDPEHIHKPKQKRASIVLQEIPQADLDEEIESKREKFPKIELELKFGFSVFNFLREKDNESFKDPEDDDEDETDESDNPEEDENLDYRSTGDEFASRLFMSNVKEEVAVNRIRLDFVSKSIKGNHYAKLYKEDYMNVIGHEVFDRACKLPKVTSLSQIIKKFGKKTVSDLHVSSDTSKKNRKINFEEENTSKSSLSLNKVEVQEEEPITNVELNSNTLERSSYVSGKQEIDSYSTTAEEETKTCSGWKMMIIKAIERDRGTNKKNCINFEKAPKLESDFLSLISDEDLIKVEEKLNSKNNRGRRKIKVKRKGKRTEEQLKMEPEVSDDEHIGRLNSSFSKTDSTYKVRDSESSSSSDSNSTTFISSESEGTFPRSNQAVFVVELSQQPVADFLSTYRDYNKKLYYQKFQNCLTEKEKIDIKSSTNLKSYLHNKKTENIMWKSKVLKTAATYKKPIDKSSSKFLNYRSSRNSSLYFSENYVEKPYWYHRLNNLVKVKKGYLIEKKDSESEMKYNFRTISRDQSGSSIPSESSYISLTLKDSSTSSFFTIKNESINESKCKLNTSKVLRWVNSSFSMESSNLNSSKTEEQNEGNVEENKISKMSNFDSEVATDDVLYLNAPGASKKVNFTIKSSLNNNKVCGGSDISNNNCVIKCDSENENDNNKEEQENVTRRDSEESFSLFYSKAADLTSPLLDMKRFIYPDHIHYSYKHVKKKGFDVDLSGRLPLLVRESLTTSLPLQVENVSPSNNLEVEITRRPMDLSFADTDEFNEWQCHDTVDSNPVEAFPELKDDEKEKILQKAQILAKGKKSKKLKASKENYLRQKSQGGFKRSNSAKNNFLLEKFLKVYKKLGNTKGNKWKNLAKKETTDQINSFRLHSNKEKIFPTSDPTAILRDSKLRAKNGKLDANEEGTENVFARLEKKTLPLQNKNHKINSNSQFRPTV